jgi:uncharacterized membrane protein YoaK (UPF0700 family)
MLNSRGNIALACALSMVAGYVDGIGFIHLGGLFVSFMSGTSTRMGVSVAGSDWYDAAEALGLIALFVAGATLGGLIARGRSRYRQAWIVLAEAALLCVAALLNAYGWSPAAITVIVVAMGLENAVFQVDGGGGLGVTYITGALVKVGQFLAAVLTGGDRWAWIPNLLLWAALAIGAVLGGLAYHRFGLAAIWLAAGVAFVLGVILAVGARATRVAERH